MNKDEILKLIPDKTEYKDTTSHKFKSEIYDFFKDLKLGTCIELGTNHGWTTLILSYLFEKVITLDHSTDNVNKARKNCSGCTNIEFICTDVYDRTWMSDIKDPIDAVFIDCIHTYDAVISDIQVALDLCTDNGIYIILDDYGHPQQNGIRLAVDEAIKAGVSVDAFIGELKGYQYNDSSILVNREGVILSYGK